MGTVQDYPRIANLYGHTNTLQTSSYSRYGLVVSNPPAAANGALAGLKSASPLTKVVVYWDNSAVDVPGFDGLTIYPGWWLCFAGTYLTVALTDLVTSTVTVNANTNISAGVDILIDQESMHVVSLVSGTTWNVTRGYYSTAATHTASTSTYVRTHASNWTGKWMLNASSYCPANGSSQKWTDYLASIVNTALGSYPWDGVFFDNVGASVSWITNGAQLDANNDNTADSGNGPSGTGWADGIISLFAAMRSLAPTTLIIGNGAYYPGSSNGEELEGFPSIEGGWADAMNQYLRTAGIGSVNPDTIVNPDTNLTGTQNLQNVRFYLATALMGNGYFAYDMPHGTTWVYDEYDKGGGSSLDPTHGTLSSGAATLYVVPGTGGKFSNGDVVHVSQDAWTNDEQMLVTGITGDALTVTRGYNGSYATSHTVPDKVMTPAQITAGQGWLGQPLGNPYSVASVGSNELLNPSFEGTSGTYLNNWTFYHGGTQTSTISQDTSTFEDGASSAKISITTSDGQSWHTTLTQSGLAVTSGLVYAVTFWTKGDAGTAITLNAPFPYDTIYLSPTWQQYTLIFTASSSGTIALEFDLGTANGTIWLDNVSFFQGDPNLYRRDFTNGIVLLNATAADQTVALGAGTFHRLAGTQDPTTNNGALVTSVTVPANDGLLLTSTVAPIVYCRRGQLRRSL